MSYATMLTVSRRNAEPEEDEYRRRHRSMGRSDEDGRMEYDMTFHGKSWRRHDDGGMDNDTDNRTKISRSGDRRGRRSAVMDEATARDWVDQMRGEDGSAGEHWTQEQIRQLQQQKKELLDYPAAEVFAVMNMMYSDYSKVAKKFGVNNLDFYVCMTKAWIDDPDAGENKTANYYEWVVRE